MPTPSSSSTNTSSGTNSLLIFAPLPAPPVLALGVVVLLAFFTAGAGAGTGSSPSSLFAPFSSSPFAFPPDCPTPPVSSSTTTTFLALFLEAGVAVPEPVVPVPAIFLFGVLGCGVALLPPLLPLQLPLLLCRAEERAPYLFRKTFSRQQQ